MSTPALVTISELTLEEALSDDALIEIEQGGASKSTSMAQIKAHVDSYTKSESNVLHGFLHTPMTASTGTMSVAKGQAFKLTAGSGRTVAFTNVPAGKALTVVVKVMGNGTVNWPAGTKWVDKVPVLKATYTYVSFLLMDGNITGHMVVSV